MADFIVRSRHEIRDRDEVLCDLTHGDNSCELYRQWTKYGGLAHLYMVDGMPSLFARGNREERIFARGFIQGWKARGRAS